jgi:hypothetical protein
VILISTCRLALRAAERIMPVSDREAWRRQWMGSLWQWMCLDATAGARDGLRPLLSHTRAALSAAFLARFEGAAGSPQTCLAAGVVLLLGLALATGGLKVSRRLLGGTPYADPDRLVLLAQGPPTLGLRLGFLESEAEVLRHGSKTLEGIATYTWYTAIYDSRAVAAAGVSGDFFRVLGIDAVPPTGGLPPVWVSSEFWRHALGSNPRAVGSPIKIDGKTMRVAGVLPGKFSFLGSSTAIWTGIPEHAPLPKDRWWMGLEGTVARLRPGIEPAAAEKELRQLLMDARMARNGSLVHATPIRTAMYRSLNTYGTMLLVTLTGVLLWASAAAYRDRRTGYSWASAIRFWGFLVAKLLGPVLAVFLFVFELSGVNRLGLTGGIWWGVELFATWVAVCGVAMAVAWARRDQRLRCRACLHRMKQPVRIGVPGHILLDPAGQEVICPKGHGAMYTSQSVLGAEMSERWVSFASY